MRESIKVDNSSVGQRLDKWIKINITKIPQSLIEKDLRNGKIKVNKKKVKSSYKLNKLDIIYLYNVSYKNLSKPKIKFIPKEKVIKETEKDIVEDNEDFISKKKWNYNEIRKSIIINRQNKRSCIILEPRG